MHPNVTPWFDPNMYAWMPGTFLGVYGGILGSVMGSIAWTGKGKSVIMALEQVFLAGSVVLLIAGIAALVSGQPYGIWYGLGLPGVLGTVMSAWFLPLTQHIYRQAEQRRLAAKDL